jgi:CRISPR/Cas system CMR-associated protein Cmr5 small subunit
MQNLEQIRAAAALQPARELSRSAVSKLPSLILNNGLLSAAAFANAEGGGGNRPHLKKAMQATTKHLACRGFVRHTATSIDDLIADLSARDSLNLQRATVEALAFLAYLKRFANKED